MNGKLTEEQIQAEQDKLKPAPQGSLPPLKDHSREISYGYYVGTDGQPNFDYWQFNKLLGEFNCESVFPMAPFGNLGLYAFVYDPKSKNAAGQLGAYSLLTIDPVWKKQMAALFESAAYYNNTVKLSLLNEYFTDRFVVESKWSPWKKHPYRDNTSDFHWSRPSEMLGKWHPDLENGISLYVQTLVQLAKETRAKYGDRFRLVIVPMNEQGATGVDDAGKSLEGITRDNGITYKREQWMRDFWDGLPWVQHALNIHAKNSDGAQNYAWVAKQSHVNLMEIHGASPVKAYELHRLGADLDNIWNETDGKDEDAGYFPNLRALREFPHPLVAQKLVLKKPLKYIGAKQHETGGHFYLKNANKTAKETIPIMRHEMFGKSGSENISCQPRTGRGPEYPFTVLDQNENKGIIVAQFEGYGCEAFFKGGDIRSGGWPAGGFPGKELWPGITCKFVYKGNGVAEITLRKSNKWWPEAGDKCYSKYQLDAPANVCDGI